MANTAKNTGQFAVIETGGKQYKVAVGDSLKIEKIGDEAKVGDTLAFDKVLMVADETTAKVGSPTLAGASVKATLTKIARHPTILVVKFKQKSRYMKRNGHRQPYFEVKIDSIKV